MTLPIALYGGDLAKRHDFDSHYPYLCRKCGMSGMVNSSPENAICEPTIFTKDDEKFLAELEIGGGICDD